MPTKKKEKEMDIFVERSVSEQPLRGFATSTWKCQFRKWQNSFFTSVFECSEKEWLDGVCVVVLSVSYFSEEELFFSNSSNIHAIWHW